MIYSFRAPRRMQPVAALPRGFRTPLWIYGTLVPLGRPDRVSAGMPRCRSKGYEARTLPRSDARFSRSGNARAVGCAAAPRYFGLGGRGGNSNGRHLPGNCCGRTIPIRRSRPNIPTCGAKKPSCGEVFRPAPSARWPNQRGGRTRRGPAPYAGKPAATQRSPHTLDEVAQFLPSGCDFCLDTGLAQVAGFGPADLFPGSAGWLRICTCTATTGCSIFTCRPLNRHRQALKTPP